MKQNNTVKYILDYTLKKCYTIINKASDNCTYLSGAEIKREASHRKTWRHDFFFFCFHFSK